MIAPGEDRLQRQIHCPEGGEEVGHLPHTGLTLPSVEDGYPLTQCVNAVRELLVRGARLTLRKAPHMLVDGLTRAGLLLPPSSVLIEDARRS